MVHGAITGGVGGLNKDGVPNAAVLGALWDAGRYLRLLSMVI